MCHPFPFELIGNQENKKQNYEPNEQTTYSDHETSNTNPIPVLSRLAQSGPADKTAETKPQPAQTQAVGRIVRFELDAPSAWSVFLVGTFNDWKPGATPLNGIGGGKWARELSLAPGRHEYRFVVDGTWIDDPKAKVYVPNPHGGRNAVLKVE